MAMKVHYWIVGLMLLGLFFAAVTGWSVFMAGRGVSSVIDPDYYDRGLKYGNSHSLRRAAEAMGWSMILSLEENRLTVRLADAADKPVSGCGGQIALHVPAREKRMSVNLELAESLPGIYTAVLPANINGTIAAELQLGRDDMVLQRNILLNIKKGN